MRGLVDVHSGGYATGPVGLYTKQVRPLAAGHPCAIMSARLGYAPQDHARWPRGPSSMSPFNGLGKRGNQVVRSCGTGADAYAERLCDTRLFVDFPSIAVARAIHREAISELNGLQAS